MQGDQSNGTTFGDILSRLLSCPLTRLPQPHAIVKSLQQWRATLTIAPGCAPAYAYAYATGVPAFASPGHARQPYTYPPHSSRRR